MTNEPQVDLVDQLTLEEIEANREQMVDPSSYFGGSTLVLFGRLFGLGIGPSS